MAEPHLEGQWSGRPWVARGVRVFVLVVPFAASVLFAWTLSRLLPAVSTWPIAILRWLLIALASTAVMVAFDRAARRLLPLATLLTLTLAFPDQAPSRFKIAMRSGTTLQLRKVIADARAGRVGDTPAEAAEKLLELVAALSIHDRLTRGHSERVRAYTHMVGEELKITGPALDHLRWSALLHDIGKLLISAEILNKPGTLTFDEFEVIKRHPDFGRELIAPLTGWLGEAARAVWEHHERWDGGGYPRGLAGTEISLAGRIVAVTDAFDVMTSARSYKDPISPVAARAELARCAGSQFDAAVVRAFLNVSLGRLRMAMGPLSWLTQMSFVPQTLVSAGTSGATAMTAVVGLTAGAIGVGLTDDSAAVARSTTELSAPPVDVDAGDTASTEFPVDNDVSGSTPDGSTPDGTTPDGSTPDDPTIVASIPGSADATASTTLTNTSAAATSSTIAAPGAAPPRGTGGAPTTSSTVTAAVAATTTPAPTTTIATSTTAAPTAAPTTAPQTVAPVPTAAPTTAAPTTTTGVAPVPTGDAGFYLGAAGSSADDFSFTNTPEPMAGTEPDHDGDGKPGLTIEKGDEKLTQADGRKFQQWNLVVADPLVLSGPVALELWSTAEDFHEKHDLDYSIWLLDCASDGSDCMILASTVDEHVKEWNGGVGDWVQRTLPVGTVDHTVQPGRMLRLRLMFDHHDAWIALSGDRPSRLLVT